MPNTILSLTTATAALFGVLALIMLTARMARRGIFGLRIAAAPSTTKLKILETIALDQRRRVHLLACDGRPFLLLTGGVTDIMLPLGPSP